MGKPGELRYFNSRPMDVEQFRDEMHACIDGFCDNMSSLNQGLKLTEFEWFYTLGYWSEALEFRDEFPQYFPEWRKKGNKGQIQEDAVV